MPSEEQHHECDLFLLSSHHQYFANRALAHFARRGWRNVDGWGIGSYIDGTAHILRSADPALASNHASGDLSREFSVAMRAVSSPVLLGHLRLASRGNIREENNHPFKLNFIDYDWLLIHNGSVSRGIELVRFDEQLIEESDSDSPRVFEFLRKRIIEYYLSGYKKSLFEACRHAYSELLEFDPCGKYNLVLSNGYISIVFIHFRPFYLLNREKYLGNVALISTIKLTDDEDWVEVKRLERKKAKMLVFSGPTLLFNGDIPK